MRQLGLPKITSFYLVVGAIAVALLGGWGSLGVLAPGADLGAWVVAVGAGLVTGLVMVMASRASTARFDWAARLANEFRNMLGTFGRREALLVAVLSAFAEEALFRGVVHSAVGLWLGALIFAALHVGPSPRFLPWTAMAFVAGLIFALLFDWTGNLLAPMLAHATVNFLNLRYLAAEVRRPDVHLGPVGGQHFARS